MKVRFSSGAATLAGQLDFPESASPRAWAVFAHCFTCSKNFKAAARLSRGLSRRGFGVLRFDFTGLGESEGDFAQTTFSSNVADLVAAARFLEGEGRAPKLLVGHSFGGPAVIRAALEMPGVTAVVTLNAPAYPEHVTKHFTREAEAARERGSATVTLAGRQFRISREFLEDLNDQRQEEALRHLNRALLVCHAPADRVVGIENASTIFAAARHPKSFISLAKADHFLGEEADAEYAAEIIAAWATAYI